MTKIKLSEGVILTLQDQPEDHRIPDDGCTGCYFNKMELLRGVPTTSCLRTELHKFECSKYDYKVWKVK